MFFVTSYFSLFSYWPIGEATDLGNSQGLNKNKTLVHVSVLNESGQ